MAFTNIAQLRTYINSTVKANGINSITGDQMNTILNGIIQFLAGAGPVTSITAGAGLDGGVITSAGTIGMPNKGIAGTYGDATHVPQITTDAQGRITSITDILITGTGYDIGTFTLPVVNGVTVIAASYTLISGLSYTPRMVSLIRKDSLVTGPSTNTVFVTYVSGGATLGVNNAPVTATATGNVVFDYIAFQ